MNNLEFISKKCNNETICILRQYDLSLVKESQLKREYNTKIKKVKETLEVVKGIRQQRLDSGMLLDEVNKVLPLSEYHKQINVLQYELKTEVEKLNIYHNRAFNLISSSLVDEYKKYITDDNSNKSSYLSVINDMLVSFGIDDKDGKKSKEVVEYLSKLIGAKTTSGTKIEKKHDYFTVVKDDKYKDLILRGLCNLLYEYNNEKYITFVLD